MYYNKISCCPLLPPITTVSIKAVVRVSCFLGKRVGLKTIDRRKRVAAMSKADEEDIKLCKETCKQFLGHFGKKKTSLHSLLERKSSAANSLLKGTMGRAYLRIGKDRAVEVDSSSLTEVTEVESLFSYKANFSVGGAKFELKFKNNSKSHKIERLWVGPGGAPFQRGGNSTPPWSCYSKRVTNRTRTTLSSTCTPGQRPGLPRTRRRSSTSATSTC